MRRIFIRDAIIYTIPTFLARAVGIFLLPIYARELGPQDLGFVELVAAAGVFILLLVPLDINQALARLIPECESIDERRVLSFTIISFTLCMFLVFGVLFYLLRFAIFALANIPPGYEKYGLIISLHFVVLGLISVLQVQFRFSQKAYHAAIMNIGIVLMNLIIVILLSTLHDLDIEMYFFSQIASGMVGIVLGGYFLRKQYGGIYFHISAGILKSALTFSMPIVVSSFGIALSLGLDRLLIAKYVGLIDLGYYGVALRFAALVSIGFNVLSSSITPIIYKDHAKPEAKRLLEQVFHVATAGCVTLLIIVTFFSDVIIYYFVGEKFSESAKYMFFVVLAAILSNGYMFFLGMDIEKRTRTIGKINLLAGLVGATCSVLLVPTFGVWGAIVTGTSVGVLRVAAYAWFSQKLYPVNYRMGVVLSLLLVLLVFNAARASYGGIGELG